MASSPRRQGRDADAPSPFDWAFPPWWPRLDDLFRDRQGRPMLRVEEFEDDETLVIRAEIPGIDPTKDVEVTVSDHNLVIRAERSEEEETANRKFHRKEFRYGSMYRAVPLPDGVNEADVKAAYKDGILEVRVPVPHATEGAPKKHVPISRG